MGYRDLREFIRRLEEEGELQRIKVEVDWNLELSAIMRRVFEINGPACLFERVKDYQFPVFSGGFFGHKKYGLAVGAQPNIKSAMSKMLQAVRNPIPPKLVEKGPCKENIDTGGRINLEKFPVPRWHHLDGGRYIGTLGVIITKDPETGIRNMGIYRQQMLGKNKLGTNTTQHLGIHLQKYRSMNKAMPIATAIGVPPELLAAATAHVAYGVDEMGIAGGIAAGPIPLVKCESIDLEVPATAEIVLEGEIPPDPDLWEGEGPFGEFTGHFSSLQPMKRPTAYLKAVTYRDTPIYQGCSPGVPPNEETTYREIGQSVGIWDKLLKSGVPGIKEVYATEMGCAQFKVIVSMDKQFYSGNARQVIDVVFGTAHGVKWVIVVDDDIDIYDMGQVEWAIAVRVQPHRDIFITDNRCTGVSLDPSIHPDLRKYPLVQTSRVGIDATTKFKGHDFPPVVRSAEEQIKQVERRWREYGFKE
jgi:4-hydroxy-3-polyprenylbenzoate decarboxylase